jgi:hypothetical protein
MNINFVQRICHSKLDLIKHIREYLIEITRLFPPLIFRTILRWNSKTHQICSGLFKFDLTAIFPCPCHKVSRPPWQITVVTYTYLLQLRPAFRLTTLTSQMDVCCEVTQHHQHSVWCSPRSFTHPVGMHTLRKTPYLPSSWRFVRHFRRESS